MDQEVSLPKERYGADGIHPKGASCTSVENITLRCSSDQRFLFKMLHQSEANKRMNLELSSLLDSIKHCSSDSVAQWLRHGVECSIPGYISQSRQQKVTGYWHKWINTLKKILSIFFPCDATTSNGLPIWLYFCFSVSSSLPPSLSPHPHIYLFLS